MPDSNPIYEKLPRPESINAFKKAVSGRSKISCFDEISNVTYLLHRYSLSDIKVYLTNIYSVSLADVVEIIGIDKYINAIVTMSVWNGYTKEAEDYCKEQGIGLFVFTEFMGALNYEGYKFINYEPKKN
jgi:hypothetical protein